MILLKNERNLLPLKKKKIEYVIFIGERTIDTFIVPPEPEEEEVKEAEVVPEEKEEETPEPPKK